ncbi:MAG: hypothetical protein IJM37_06170 [Lachnospiraceae bacterium]|nr:hypothetical protein [Lachnospiraceae bacterium]
MKNKKILISLLIGCLMMVMLSACEISKENNNSNTQTQADTLPEVVTYNDAKGDDLSGGLCEDGAEGYRVWYADNGDIYAFDAVDNFYLKKADSVYYGVYEFYSYNSAEQYGFLQFMCDNSKDINERFSVVKEGEDFVLTSQSDSSKKIRISKTNSNTAEDLSGKSIYEIMGFNLYYITKDSFDDSELEMVVNACPASYEKAEDGASKYSYDTENAKKFKITEDSFIYMPNRDELQAGTFGCDMIYFNNFITDQKGFYAIIMGEDSDAVETVQYYYVK